MTFKSFVKEQNVIVLFVLLGFIAFYAFSGGIMFEKEIHPFIVAGVLAVIFWMFDLLKKDLKQLEEEKEVKQPPVQAYPQQQRQQYYQQPQYPQQQQNQQQPFQMR